jgi:DNA-binding GntR family transcriptional regulator
MRMEIMNGKLRPGGRIVEGTWAAKFGVTQASIPEAINMLAQEGLAGNLFLLQNARRVLLPFLAFVRMRVTASYQETSAWSKDVEAHQRIIDLIREGESDIARQHVNSAMERFAKTACANWEKRGNQVG